ncbi:MAG: crossover junction endodeoxyribonuclease RuvC [Rickettsiaceae bacterium H1]|nr:crossover junction endodeoxyribonuclease RuvC [Rickettsiaceae bacterium H1]
MKIIGIDPGLNCTGWGIIQVENNKVRYMDSGKIKTYSKTAIDKRLYRLHQELLTVLERHKPESAAIEETFVNKNPKSSLSLCQARGALLLTLSIAGIANISLYPANHIKKAITGNGHAEKHQIIKTVEYIIKEVKGKITHDIADALAIALCHYYQNY